MSGADVVGRRSARLAGFMDVWLDRFARAHLASLRVARWGLPDAAAGPLVIVANHPSWWDPVTFFLLHRRLLGGRACFAPIDAAMLERYRIFGRLGAFPVESGGRRGAAAFLAEAQAVLADRRHVLWVTAQGRFADPRLRPLALRPGVAHLAGLAPEGAALLPLAIEYPFWTERGAEALAAFGPPLDCGALRRLERRARPAAIEAALTATMDRLAVDAQRADPAAFVTLFEGKAGIGGVYDLWRAARAWARGERFDPRHASAMRADPGAAP